MVPSHQDEKIKILLIFLFWYYNYIQIAIDKMIDACFRDACVNKGKAHHHHRGGYGKWQQGKKISQEFKHES